MKAYPPLLRNTAIFVIFLFICFGMISSADAAQERKVESLEEQVKSKNLQQWIKYYVPFFNPTEAELQERLRNDPKSSPYYHPEKFQGVNLGDSVEGQSTENLPAAGAMNVEAKQKPGLPKDAYVAVVIPKGMSLPQQAVNTKGVQSQDMPQTQQQVIPLSPQSEGVSFPMAAPMNTNGNLIQPPTPEKNYAGIWTGQYNKLIEYFDKASESWKPSENSLRDVPVELNFSSNGQLAYKMPEREGSATFSVRNGYLSIFCSDVRVRGDYEVFQKDSSLLMRTSRVLVKDKMRVSLEFKLASKA